MKIEYEISRKKISPDSFSPDSFSFYNVKEFIFQKRPKSNVFHIEINYKNGYSEAHVRKNIVKFTVEDD